MAIAVGDRIPDVQLKMVGEHGTEQVGTAEVLGKGRVVVFGVPGAFTPVCSDRHLPGFVARSTEILARGVDGIYCIAVNDHHVMAAWARWQGVAGRVKMLADGNGTFARATGLEIDLSDSGLGMRNKRYAAILEDGVVAYVAVEDGTGLEVSTAERVLAALP